MFATLDKKLSLAILGLANKRQEGQLGNKIRFFVDECLRLQSRTPGGCELLCLVFQYYRVGDHAHVMNQRLDLANVRLQKGKLEAFLQNWDSTLTGMVKAPNL